MKKLIPMMILSLIFAISCGETSNKDQDAKFPQDSSTISKLGQDSETKLPPDFGALDEERTVYTCIENTKVKHETLLVEQTIVLSSGTITKSETLQAFNHSKDCKQALLELTDELHPAL